MAFRVIEGGGTLRRRQYVPTDGGFILPPVKLDTAYLSTWVGLTSRQANEMFYAAAAMDDRKAVAAATRVFNAAREMEAALTEYRQVLLGAMQVKWPRAARRIMKGLARR